MAAGTLAFFLILGCIGGCGAAGQVDALTGKWVSLHDGSSITFMADGKVTILSEKSTERKLFKREVLEDRERRLNAQAPGSSEAKQAADFAKLFGPKTEMISFYDGKISPANLTGFTFYWSDSKIVGDAFTAMYVPVSSPYAWRGRRIPGKRENAQFRPFEFIKPGSFVVSDGEGEATYSWKGDWSSVVTQAAPELRRQGFRFGLSAKEERLPKVSDGGIWSYRFMDTEKVTIQPEWRVAKKNGKGVGAKAKGWITVFVSIRPQRDILAQKGG